MAANSTDTTPAPLGKYFILIQEFHGEESDLEKQASAWHIYPKVNKYCLNLCFCQPKAPEIQTSVSNWKDEERVIVLAAANIIWFSL